MSGIEIVLLVALFAPVVWMLERTHRRTRALPRLPLGADADSLAALEYRRALREMRTLSQAADVPHAAGSAGAPGPPPGRMSGPLPDAYDPAMIDVARLRVFRAVVAAGSIQAAAGTWGTRPRPSASRSRPSVASPA